MLKVWCFSLVLVALASCALAAPVDSGIQGRVTVGPSCPVVRADVPCPDRPYAATLTVLSDPGHRRITSVTADDLGYYRVLLPPGSYVIHPESPAVLPRGSDVVVQVLPHQFTRQDIQYDSGIR